MVAFWPAEATRDAPPALRRRRPAATSMRLGLDDECWLFVNPVALGAGTPLSATSAIRLELSLVEARTFADAVVLLRYARP